MIKFPMKSDNIIFTVRKEDLARLSPQEATDLFRELLWAEARKIGMPVSKIHVSSSINVPDGGIDASVEDNIISTKSDMIKDGLTSYQIKTGENFKPWNKTPNKKGVVWR
jgi:predicted AAA+ superfamily ATPase